MAPALGFGGTRPMRLGDHGSGLQPNYDWNAPNAYRAAIPQTGQDYDAIMRGYKDLLDKASRPANALNDPTAMLRSAYTQDLNKPPVSWQNINPVMESYEQSDDVTKSLGELEELSRTGGYSPQAIQELRARGVSPIRAVYANMLRNMDRQKNIQGGYSPGHSAASARMAREASELVAGQTSNVNAGIAEAVAANRLSAAPNYASAAGNEANRLQGTNSRNAATQNTTNQFNATGALTAAQTNAANRQAAASGLSELARVDNTKHSNTLDALEGMRSLYGTTPALANTFGQQALATNQFNANQQQAQTANKLAAQAAPSRFGTGLGIAGNVRRSA